MALLILLGTGMVKRKHPPKGANTQILKCIEQGFSAFLKDLSSVLKVPPKILASTPRYGIILVFGVLLTLPLLHYGFWPYSGDAQVNINWYSHFSSQLWAGDPYPRWLWGMNRDLGSPVFFFYPPLPYFITSVFRPLVSNDPQGWHQLGISACCALVGSGLSSYLLLRDIVSKEWPALVGSLLYMLIPFHLCVDLFNRAAFAEFWSFVWIPLIILATRAIVKGSHWGVLGLSFSYAGLIMTHLPTTLIFSPVPIAYAWFSSKNKCAFPILVKTVMAMALGIGLASAYLIPAMTMQDYVSIKALFTGLEYNHSFFSFASIAPPAVDIYNKNIYLMVFSSASILVPSSLLIIFGDYRHLRGEALFWLTVVCACIFMMLPLSDPIWKLIKTIQIIQFPWRFGVVLCIAVVAVAAVGLSGLDKVTSKWCLGFSIFLISAITFTWFNFLIATNWSTKAVARANYVEHPARSDDVGEWSPRWVGNQRDAATRIFGSDERGLVRFQLCGSIGESRHIDWEHRSVELTSDSITDGNLVVYQFYFPGWAAFVDSRRVPVSPSEEGLVQIHIPSGHHHIRLTLLPEIAERAGKMVSEVSLSFLVLFGILLLIGNRKAQHYAPRQRGV